MLRNVPNSAGIVDDILCHGNEETTHDAAAITLLKTPRANNLTFNANKFVFKSQDCAFFGGQLTPAGYKMDPQKMQAISEMKPPENLQDLQSFLGVVNYLNRFSPALADSTAPLRAPGRARSKQHLRLSRKRLRVYQCCYTLISPKLALFSQTHPGKA